MTTLKRVRGFTDSEPDKEPNNGSSNESSNGSNNGSNNGSSNGLVNKYRKRARISLLTFLSMHFYK